MQVKKQQLELDMEQKIGSKLRKGYLKAVYCHLAYLTYMQSTSCEILDWMKHKHNNLRYAHDSTVMAEIEELRSLLLKVKVESEKVGLNFNILKTKIMASGPITSWQIDGETGATVTDFIFFWLQSHCRW